jgi:hypothetical protein
MPRRIGWELGFETLVMLIFYFGPVRFPVGGWTGDWQVV